MLIPSGLTLGQKMTAHREGGLIVTVYPDPITKAAPWTGGVGCTGPLITKPGVIVSPGLLLSVEEWLAEYLARYARDKTQAELDLGAPYWVDLDEVRRAVLCDIAHQNGGGNAKTGIGGLAGYHRMLAAVRAEDWPEAQAECLDSLDHKQTPGRCEENADMLRTGQWPVWLPALT